MLVRVDRRARPQLVLLDHGLYKQLPDDLRLEYAGLWQALVFGDEAVSDLVSHIASISCGTLLLTCALTCAIMEAVWARLWCHLCSCDTVVLQGIKEHAARMNAGELYPLFAAMLTSRPWEEVTRKTANHLYIPQSPSERQVLQQRAQAFAQEINELLGRMPPDLLLLLKTNDCLRAVDLALGQVVSSSMVIHCCLTTTVNLAPHSF